MGRAVPAEGVVLMPGDAQPGDASALDPDADTENPAGSVFCAHGAGYFVPWNESDALMHLPVEQI